LCRATRFSFLQIWTFRTHFIKPILGSVWQDKTTVREDVSILKFHKFYNITLKIVVNHDEARSNPARHLHACTIWSCAGRRVCREEKGRTVDPCTETSHNRCVLLFLQPTSLQGGSGGCLEEKPSPPTNLEVQEKVSYIFSVCLGMRGKFGFFADHDKALLPIIMAVQLRAVLMFGMHLVHTLIVGQGPDHHLG